jgi:hypothetical protein
VIEDVIEDIAQRLERIAAEVRQYGLKEYPTIKFSADAVQPFSGVTYGTMSYSIKLSMDTGRPVPPDGIPYYFPEEAGR